MASRKTVTERTAVITLAMAFFGLLLLFWAAARPANRIQVIEPIPVEVKTVYAGDGLRLHHTYCEQDAATAIVGGFIESQGVIIPLQHLWASSLPKGCHDMTIDLQIPMITPPGLYRLSLIREYRSTLFTQSSYLFKSEPFTVLAREEMTPIRPAAPLPETPPEQGDLGSSAKEPSTSLWQRLRDHLWKGRGPSQQEP